MIRQNITKQWFTDIGFLLDNIDFMTRQMAGPGARDRRLRPSRSLHRWPHFTPD